MDGEIIETYWNVNNVFEEDKKLYEHEIIETYWNVNVYGYSMDKSFEEEIIETYWNVNAFLTILLLISLNGNNRNILECK